MLSAGALGQSITVHVENLSPSNGTFMTPVWFGFHDGSFDLFNVSEAASPELERLAEDGAVGPLSSAFLGGGSGRVDGTVTGPMIPPIGPGHSGSASFSLTPGQNDYLTFASMVIPSNDAFVGNGDPRAFRIFDASGNFIPQSFVIAGDFVFDAGTEVNDEIPANTAFFGQMSPNTGTTENGTVGFHPGFIDSFRNPGGSASILGDPMFAGADFTAPDYQVLRLTLVPAPGALGVLGLGGLVALRRRR
jgi:hypothetical protein